MEINEYIILDYINSTYKNKYEKKNILNILVVGYNLTVSIKSPSHFKNFYHIRYEEYKQSMRKEKFKILLDEY